MFERGKREQDTVEIEVNVRVREEEEGKRTEEMADGKKYKRRRGPLLPITPPFFSLVSCLLSTKDKNAKINLEKEDRYCTYIH